MLRYSFWATVAALALWVGGSGTAQAQHRGGGHGGGVGHAGGVGHGDGGHGDGGRWGGYRGYGYYPYGGFGIGIYASPYRSYGYGYGYPDYGSYGYSYPYSTDTSVYPSTVYSTTQYGPSIVPVSTDANITQSGYYTPGTDNRARVHVRLPADAQLWVDGDPTQQTGSERDFVTPPLTSAGTYTLKARWMQGNEPVERSMKVDVRPGQTSQVDFMQ
jgi:uncharacterized protein (TIGR03000 family)